MVLLYYAAILTLHFRKDIYWYYLRYQNSIGSRVVQDRNDQTTPTPNGPQENNAWFTAAEKLVAALKKLFSNAARQHFQKEEVVMALQLELRNYMELKGTAFEVAINNHITQKAIIECGIVLEDTDIKNLWKPSNFSTHE